MHIRPCMRRLIALARLAAMAPILAVLLGAISPSMTWEVRTTGSDTACSGGFRGGAFIAAPSAPSVANAGTGGTVAANTYFCVVTYTDGLGDTVISGQMSTTTSGSTSTITVTSPAAATGAITWNCYFGTTTAGPYFPQGTGLTIGSNRVVTTTPPTTGTQPLGVNRQLQNSAQVTIDNSVITATTTGANSNTLTFTAGYVPTAADVGNSFRSTGGTNINVGFYEVTGVTSTTWTVSGGSNLTTAGGAGSAITGVMGGAFASPGQAASITVIGNSIYVKSGTYTLANGTANTAGNKLSITIDTPLIGYSTNRHPANSDTAPVLDAGAASMTVLAVNQNFIVASNISITNSGSNATVTGFSQAGGSSCYFRNISVNGCATGINVVGSSSSWVDCTASSGGGFSGNGNGTFYRCTALGFTAAPGFLNGSGSHYIECVASGGSSQGGFSLNGGSTCTNCIGYGNGLYGFNVASANTYYRLAFMNCIAYGNTTYGFKSTTHSYQGTLYNCAAGNNTTADFDANFASYQKSNCVTLTANPFTNAVGNDFSLNATSGGGLSCKATGIPGTWPGLSTTGFRDIGMWQGNDAVGGGLLVNPGKKGGKN